MTDKENVLDPEEVQEWDDFMEELLEAVEYGLLDKHIKVIAKSCYKRRDVLIEQRNARRKPKPGGSTVVDSTPGRTNPYRNMELTALSYEAYGSIAYDGAWFHKHDLQSVWPSVGHKLLFTNTKLDECTVQITKVNRTNAVLRVVKAEGWKARSGRGRIEDGDKINMPLQLLVREAVLQTKNYHAWHAQNGNQS